MGPGPYPCLRPDISKWNYIFHLVPVLVLVSFLRSVNVPLMSIKQIDGKDYNLSVYLFTIYLSYDVNKEGPSCLF